MHDFNEIIDYVDDNIHQAMNLDQDQNQNKNKNRNTNNNRNEDINIGDGEGAGEEEHAHDDDDYSDVDMQLVELDEIDFIDDYHPKTKKKDKSEPAIVPIDTSKIDKDDFLEFNIWQYYDSDNNLVQAQTLKRSFVAITEWIDKKCMDLGYSNWMGNRYGSVFGAPFTTDKGMNNMYIQHFMIHIIIQFLIRLKSEKINYSGFGTKICWIKWYCSYI